jgi:proteasome assembly chaperone (PAC2) family protein
MNAEKLKIYREPRFANPRLVLGFSGWMDGGEVSTGTIRYLRDKLRTDAFAHIDPEGFYIYGFPGSMEVSALFRPHTRISDGLVLAYDPPANTFFCDPRNNVILFSGKEPHLAWEQYADCIFALCDKCGVREIYFIGSVAGVTPHTREPRITCSVSDEKLKDNLKHPGMRFSRYEGPASIVTYLTYRAAERKLSMISLVAEIPAYVQGYNPRSIETTLKCLCRLLDLQINLDDLRESADEFEKRLSDIVAEQPELARKVTELEEDYDNQVFDTEMGDLKEWLQQKGIRLD